MWCSTDEEWEYTLKVQAMIEGLRWKKVDDYGGGITWIELFAIYARQMGAEDEKRKQQADPLRAQQSFQSHLA